MAFQKRTAIVSMAALVMIVAMTMSEVEGRLSVGRNLLEGTSERRYLMDIVGAVAGKHCCNTVITKCCAPPPAPTPTRKLASTPASTASTAASAPKSSKAGSGKSSPKSKDNKSPKSKDNKSPKSKANNMSSSPSKSRAASKSTAAQAPKAMRKKTTSVKKE